MSGSKLVAVGIGPDEVVLLGKESGMQIKMFSQAQADTVAKRINDIDPSANAYVISVNSSRVILDALKKAREADEKEKQ